MHDYACNRNGLYVMFHACYMHCSYLKMSQIPARSRTEIGNMHVSCMELTITQQGFIQRRGPWDFLPLTQVSPSRILDSAIYFVLLSPSKSDWFPPLRLRSCINTIFVYMQTIFVYMQNTRIS